jgi:hypothetical protein
LQREYERALIRAHERNVATSTLQAAEWLASFGQPGELCAWLSGRSAREIEAIQQHLQKKKGDPHDDNA